MREAAPLLMLLALFACRMSDDGSRTETDAHAATTAPNRLIDLWSVGLPAFGVYVPDERPPGDGARRSEERQAPVYTVGGGARLGQNPLYDFVFLNLEGAYDAAAVSVIAEGLRASITEPRKTLLVRIPPIARDGEEVTRARVREVLDLGADGVILPHIRSAVEAETAVRFFGEAGADVWSPTNRDGSVIAMLMVEDPDALHVAAAIADVPGYSILACGIGSLTRALNGDRVAAEAGNQVILAHAKRVGMADMITADSSSVAQRVREGFLALLMQGPAADDVIRIGRVAAGRPD